MEEKLENQEEENQEVEEEIKKEATEEQEFNLEEAKKDVEEIVESVDYTADAIKKIEEREAELFQKEVALTLKENGLEQFEGLVNIDDPYRLDEVVYKLTNIVNDIKQSAGYVPKENLSSDSYDTAKEKGDSRSMIKALFGRR